MINLSEIIGFDWDSGNSRKSVKKHDVSQSEAEQLFFNVPLLLLSDSKHSQEEARYHALGKTDAARQRSIRQYSAARNGIAAIVGSHGLGSLLACPRVQLPDRATVRIHGGVDGHRCPGRKRFAGQSRAGPMDARNSCAAVPRIHCDIAFTFRCVAGQGSHHAIIARGVGLNDGPAGAGRVVLGPDRDRATNRRFEFCAIANNRRCHQ